MMKNILVFVILCNVSLSAQTIKVMTYNIRFATEADGNNSWENRKEAMVDFLREKKPAIIGTQEGLNHQLNYLINHLENYVFIGDARDDGNKKGEYSAILYDTTKVEVLKEETIWLCEPNDKDTIGWDAAMKRICTYGLFRDKSSDEEFWVYNAHFDHVGVQARTESSKLITKMNFTKNQPPKPVVVMGDFNSEPETEAIENFKIMFSDGLAIAGKRQPEPLGTFTGFDKNAILDRRIDWIFVQGFKVKSYLHFNERRGDGEFISDHLPVMAELSFK